jgi:hypothetical protein
MDLDLDGMWCLPSPRFWLTFKSQKADIDIQEGNEGYNYGELEVNADDEEDEDQEDELDAWAHIDTPPPSPPPTPPPARNDLEDGEYDGFVHVDHDDLEIYERWYAEQCDDELRELRE